MGVANERSGVFIAIDGIDGTGKGTQHEMMVNRGQKHGLEVAEYDFPQYGQPSADFVERYLRGEFGGEEEVSPYKASTFFALDRFDASPHIQQDLDEGRLVIANRYVGANMAHQGGKISNEKERAEYFEWLDEYEFTILGIPRPDRNFILHIPPGTASRLIAEKKQRAYLRGEAKDIHELSVSHLQRSEEVYLQLCELYPDHFTLIECMDGGDLMAPSEINDILWQELQPYINDKGRQ